LVSSSNASFLTPVALEPGRGDHNRISGANVLTKSATGAFISNYRIFSALQAHSPPLDRAAFIARTAEQVLDPGKTFFAVKLGKSHPHLFNGYIVEGVRRTDGGTAHAEVAWSFLGVNFRGTGHKKVKTTPHLDAVKDADLSALSALETARKKFFFTSGSRGSEETFFIIKHDELHDRFQVSGISLGFI